MPLRRSLHTIDCGPQGAKFRHMSVVGEVLELETCGRADPTELLAKDHFATDISEALRSLLENKHSIQIESRRVMMYPFGLWLVKVQEVNVPHLVDSAWPQEATDRSS